MAWKAVGNALQKLVGGSKYRIALGEEGFLDFPTNSEQTFTQADLISDGFGGFTLPITLSDTQVPIMILLDDGTTKTNLVPQYQDGVLYGFTNNNPQTIIVKIQ